MPEAEIGHMAMRCKGNGAANCKAFDSLETQDCRVPTSDEIKIREEVISTAARARLP
jgi:hypothetical protein